MDDIFVRSLLVERVKIKPKYMCQEIQDLLRQILSTKFEGKCSCHGYIKPNSIQIYRHSIGKVMDVSLNGDISYNVQFYAQVCNPSVGSIVKAKVINMNKFGILAECSIPVARGESVAVLEIIVAKSVTHDTLLDNIKQNDIITVEVMGKKYELNDRKISIVGKVVVGENKKGKSHKHVDDVERDEEVDEDEDANNTDFDDESTEDTTAADDENEEDDENADEDDEEEDNPDDESEDAENDDEVEEGFASDNNDEGFFTDSDGAEFSDGENDLSVTGYR